ncbi:DUF6807 family protein, partial [Arthrobacter sp. H5]|uniref:DUF6807 family protein n=1 Tax=Arthrobacter sp. H5 TaxID=1267973 RepID=UPI0006886376
MLNSATHAPGNAAQNVPGAAIPRLALVGVHGYGASHLENIARLEMGHAAELVAVADPNPPSPGVLGGLVQIFEDLDQLLSAGVSPDVVVIAAPIQAHAPLALAALAAGADVYLEKPPVASMAQFNELLLAAEAAGAAVQTGFQSAAVQTGFQSMGSAALNRIESLIDSVRIGSVQGISAAGTWTRTRGYFKRSRWAGKRTLNGVEVVDGVTTNPLSHAVATALAIAGARTAADVASVETDLYRAHEIECDDTSTIRVRTASGTVVTCALTLCSPDQTPPSITIHGTSGSAVLYYTTDKLITTTADGDVTEHFDRADLLENLLEHRASGAPLISSLKDSGAFMRIMEAVRTAEPPQLIPSEHIQWIGQGDDAHPVIAGISELVRRAGKSQATFSELGAPWARTLPAVNRFQLGDREVARYLDGTHVMPTSSPRPYLHPVSTLAGTVVSDHLPLDHVWHLGAGVAIQDVNGVNFWGGRTYRREAEAYVWRDDHGRIQRTCAVQSADSLEETLSWNGPDGATLLHEARRWRWQKVADAVWSLTLEFALSPAADKPVSLGSPGSNGRTGGGYGGFFWRLPSCTAVDMRTSDRSGEDAVHGSNAPWLSWRA